MELSGCMSLLQGYLENSPLIVLGSGASMPYELPSMSELAEEIYAELNSEDETEQEMQCNLM